MEQVQFPEVNYLYGGSTYFSGEPGFRPRSSIGNQVVCCWRLSFRERLCVLFTGRIWQVHWAFDIPWHPCFLATERPLVLRAVEKEKP